MASYSKLATNLVAMAILAAIGPVAEADYTAPRFFELVGGADLIVLGQVESIQDATYHLKIERMLVGKWQAPTVTVMKVHDWACSWRHAPYAVGDRVVVFLERADDRSKHLGMTVFAQMSAGCEGELPVDGATVYCYSIHGSPESCGTIGRHRDVYKAKLDDLMSAIEDYRSLYRVTLGKKFPNKYQMLAECIEPSRDTLRLSVDAYLRRIKEFKRASYLHQYLIDSTEEAIDTLAGKLPIARPVEKPEVKKPDTGPIIIRYRGASAG